jgi:imidazolonepropionase-like amidohydrolase
MQEGGMTPAEVLVATTKTAAELMALQDELGTLEPGKRADLVLVDGDALDLVKLGDRVTAVFKDGERVMG